jgi:hypothetical protein
MAVLRLNVWLTRLGTGFVALGTLLMLVGVNYGMADIGPSTVRQLTIQYLAVFIVAMVCIFGLEHLRRVSLDRCCSNGYVYAISATMASLQLGIAMATIRIAIDNPQPYHRQQTFSFEATVIICLAIVNFAAITAVVAYRFRHLEKSQSQSR